MGVYVNLIEEIRTRIQWQIDDSGSLSNIKRVILGNRARVETHDTLPVIVLEIDSIADDYAIIAINQKEADFNVRLVLLFPITDQDTDNLYYDTTLGTGIIYTIEKLLDCLNSRTRGAAFSLTFPFTFYAGTEIDPRLAQNSRTAIRATVQTIVKNAGYLEAVININAKTNFFTINGVRS